MSGRPNTHGKGSFFLDGTSHSHVLVCRLLWLAPFEVQVNLPPCKGGASHWLSCRGADFEKWSVVIVRTSECSCVLWASVSRDSMGVRWFQANGLPNERCSNPDHQESNDEMIVTCNHAYASLSIRRSTRVVVDRVRA